MSPPNDDGGHSPPGAPAAHESSSHRQDAAQPQNVPEPLDGEAAILGVLVADETWLRQVLRQDRAVRHALRWRPNDGDAERARTLVAAARVEQRRRAGAGVLGAVVAAVRAGGAR